MSNSSFINFDKCSALNERIDTAKWRFLSNKTLPFCCSWYIASSAAYSLSERLGDILISHSGKLFLIASNHSVIPPSPVLISCPPPTKQIITAQSLCLSKQDIKNSGSEYWKFVIPFLRSIKSTVCFLFQALWASSKIATWS